MAEPVPTPPPPSTGPPTQTCVALTVVTPMPVVAWPPAEAQTDPDEPHLFVAAIREDQARRWAAGKQPRVEDYLRQLGTTPPPEVLRGLVVHEWELRRRYGPPPTAAEFRDRFPTLPGLAGDLGTDPGPAAPRPPGGPADSLRPTLIRGGDATPFLATDDDPLPVVPDYEIHSRIGEGAMGVVYLAVQKGLKRPVALKMIKPGWATPGARRRFKAEVEAIARFDDPHIVKIFDVGEAAGLPFCALEYVSGGSLDRRLRHDLLPVATTARLVEQLAKGVQYAHTRGVLHRDLKPANILIQGDPDGPLDSCQLKISDFGLAKFIDAADAGQTHPGAVLGTPNYMAPEQASGRGSEVGPPTDVHALGAILYEALTGRPPFQGDSVYDTLEQVRYLDPVPPRRLRGRLPRDLETVTLKCLQKDPGRRYRSAGELAEDLRRFLDGEPIKARPAGPLERAWRWARRKPTQAALTAAVLIVGLNVVFSGLYYLNQQAKVARQSLDRLQKWNERVAELRVRVSNARDPGQIREAVAILDQAESDLNAEADFDPAGLRTELNQLRTDLKEADKQHANRRDQRKRFEQFEALRSIALLHETLAALPEGGPAPRVEPTDDDRLADWALAAALGAANSRGRAGEAARAALDVYGLNQEVAEPAEAVAGLMDEHLSDAEKVFLRAAFVELLLVRAEAEAARSAFPRALATLALAEVIAGTAPAELRRRRAGYLKQQGDEAGSRAELERVKSAPPDVPLDAFADGLRDCRRGGYAEAMQHFDRVLIGQPAHFAAHYAKGVCLLRQRRWAHARQVLDACLSHRGAEPEAPPRLLRAVTFIAEGKDAEADLVVAVGPPAAVAARSLRGLARARQKRWPEAVAELAEAARLRPDDYQAFRNLAHAHRGGDDPEAALKALSRAVELAPDRAGLYRDRAGLHAIRGDRLAAIGDLVHAIRLAGAGRPAERGRDHTLLAELRLAAGGPRAALASLEDALRADPEHGPALLLKAEVLFELGRLREAGPVLDRYLAVPGRATAKAYETRGMIHVRLQEYLDAAGAFNLALGKSDQEDLGLLRHRGRAYLMANYARQAQEDFVTILTAEPDDDEARVGLANTWLLLQEFDKAVAAAGPLLHPDRLDQIRDPKLLILTARVFAVAADKATGSQTARQLQGPAVELLGRALSATPEHRRPQVWAEFRSDRALESLRRTPNFVNLERRFGLDTRRPGAAPPGRP